MNDPTQILISALNRIANAHSVNSDEDAVNAQQAIEGYEKALLALPGDPKDLERGTYFRNKWLEEKQRVMDMRAEVRSLERVEVQTLSMAQPYKVHTSLKHVPIRYAGGTEEGATHMGEPAFADQVLVSRSLVQRLYREIGLSGAVPFDKVLQAALEKLKEQTQ